MKPRCSPSRLRASRPILIAVGVAAVPAWVLAGPTDDERAEKAFREGVELFKKDDMPAAEAKFEEAWALKKTADIAGNLGGAEFEQKKWDEAANHLWFCEQNLPLTAPKAQRDAVKAQLAEAKKHVGELGVDVTPDGVPVAIDERPVGMSPLPKAIFVLPGTHRVSASRGGLRSDEKIVEVAAEKRVPVELKLAPVDVAPSASSSASAGPSASASGGLPPSKPVWPYVLTGSVAAVGLGVGVGMLVAASGASDDATTLAASTTCKPPSQSCIDQGGALQDDAALFSNLAAVGFSVAGAAALGAVIYAAVPASKSASTTAVVVPVLAPSFQGFSVFGAF